MPLDTNGVSNVALTGDVAAQLLAAGQQSAAAALAGGIIAASGRPHSVAQAMAVYMDVYFTLYPAPGDGRYDAWKASDGARLAETP